MASTEPLRGASHRRLNPLTGEWVLVSPHRAQRPWQGQRESKAAPAALAHDPNCYLCPGNLRVGGARNPTTRTPSCSTMIFRRCRLTRRPMWKGMDCSSPKANRDAVACSAFLRVTI